ncbi:protein new-glue 2 isoform X1 [Drosophila gunungcola]|uniref:protein new-glue 2 isoform X1 n=2 Tax=Drosophila gunungcola TaxID=103775 RepID=UPI0022E1B4A7|nr:protein new-glue 2 isoform X1 [Drosophila gunungcola]
MRTKLCKIYKNQLRKFANNLLPAAKAATFIHLQPAIRYPTMRAATILTVVVVLATCLLRSSEAVTCTADPTDANCIDCSTNTTNAECETTTTTVAPTTTVAETTTVTTTTVSSSRKRKIVRLSNMRYTAVRRIRVNRNSSRSSTIRTTLRNRRRRNNSRRVNVRRGNVRIIVG